MRYARLSTREWIKRQKQSNTRLTKIRTALLNYMDKHHIDGSRCKKCKIRVTVGARTKHATRLRCPKCKKVRIIKMDLPRRFTPTNPVKKIKRYHHGVKPNI